MNEVWKDIKGYEEYYQVSNLGKVRSLPRFVNGKNNSLVFRKGRIIVGGVMKYYKGVLLYKNNIRKTVKIHRLVAEAFLPNPNNLPQVNHKNGDKLDNRVENLEWCSAHENNLHKYKVLGYKGAKAWQGKFGKDHCSSKIILQIKDGKIVAEFYGSCEAERKTNICNAHIRDCCKNKRKTAGGYRWQYKPKKDEE